MVNPSIASLNCHITDGFSGLPKLRQFVAAMGRAPLVATLRAASATACIAPTRGFNSHQRPLPSVARASARFTFPVSGSLMRITAASLAPGPASVLVRTDVSYCFVARRRLRNRPLIYRPLFGQWMGRNLCRQLAAVPHAQKSALGHFANNDGVESPFLEDIENFLLAAVLGNQQHALLRFTEHDLVRCHARFPLRHFRQIDFD